MSSLSSPRAPSQYLPWDDEDEPTQRSLRSRRPPPPTRRQYRSGERARAKDTLVDMDHAPETERDIPRTLSSPQSPASDAFENAQPESEVRPAVSRMVDDDFDHRATTKRPTAPKAESGPDAGPISSPIALRSLPGSAPPSRVPGERLLARSAHMPLVPSAPELNHLRHEVGKLRFRLLFTTVVAVVALTSSLVLAFFLLWPALAAPTKPPSPARSAALAALPQWPAPDAFRVSLPAVPELPPAPAEVPEGRVEVVITLLTPQAAVALTRFGEMPQQLSGPWPVTLHLEPGKYTLTASRMGKNTIMRMLDVSLDRPRREVTLQVR